MSDWKTFPQNVPVALTDCWVRREWWFGEPFLAQYNSEEEAWFDNINNQCYPIWEISRWKYA